MEEGGEWGGQPDARRGRLAESSGEGTTAGEQVEEPGRKAPVYPERRRRKSVVEFFGDKSASVTTFY